MDRILYFRITGKREETSNYRIQLFRRDVCGKDIVYLQVCGYPKKEQVALVQEEMKKALSRVLTWGRKDEEDQAETSLVCDYSFEKWLEDMDYRESWHKMWKYPMYDAFCKKENVLYMLEQIPREQFPRDVWLLGSGPDMREWVSRIADRIRSLTFCVEFVTRSLEHFRDELEEEFGLVSHIRLVSPGEFRKERFQSDTPVLVADYSGKEKIMCTGLCKGSIWLDMDSVESKRHSLEDRRTGVQYISLKKIWKEEIQQTLDTISNFEYNTEVKLDGFAR